jgi:hypothetical protein
VDVPEGGAIHFECRVEPVGDSTMRIDWFHNGRPFATGSRVHMLNDFGFVVLDMDYTYARDSGEYICRATNKWGSATTKATLTCKGRCILFISVFLQWHFFFHHTCQQTMNGSGSNTGLQYITFVHSHLSLCIYCNLFALQLSVILSSTHSCRRE